ncbi:type VII secretion integral membrane protein EccD [Symbioplanes lichenis]|uniref:type VII secretion integral membrane protein EccD n=1 Tax=Symbioplanes lichenis TaxID=1629072 RepID=UPI00273A23BD|nr:type VII secretion integral membrane protein EccD [Actinoplanes lichenis]
MNLGLARVTISAPRRRLDVALPEHVPLAELLPEVLRHAGEELADDGERHGGWILRRTDGVPLTPAEALAAQGVRDGEVLYLRPARSGWPELEYDDVVEAIADEARRRSVTWTPAATRMATLAGAGVLLAVGALAVLAAGPSWGAGVGVGLGGAVLLALAGTTASRAYGDAAAGAVLGGAALPYAFAGGSVLISQPEAAGAVPGLAWLGGPGLLTGSVALLLFAVLAGAGVATLPRIFAAGVTAGLLGALAALAGLWTSAAGAAAVLMCVLVCGIGLLPVLAIRFGGVPGAMPVAFVPAASRDDRSGADERPDRARVGAAVGRTEEMLVGMLIGHAVAAAGAFVVLAAGGTAARILAALAVAALLLRSRLFVTVRQRVPLLAGGLTGLFALGTGLVRDAGSTVLLVAAAAVVVLAVVVVAAGVAWSRRPPSPYLGRAADLLDNLAVIAVIPVACAVVGLYGLVSTISL